MTTTVSMSPATRDPNRFDQLARVAVDHVTRHGPPPLQRALVPLRAAAMTATLEPRRARAEAIAEDVRAGRAGARDQLAALATQALSAMRAEVARRARGAGLLTRVLARGDELWRNCAAGELLDDPALDPALRTGIMTTLDQFNDAIAVYQRFLTELVPLAHPERPTRVLDLAAGHGGFAITAARWARQTGHDLRFTASDIKPEYLELGAAIARREGLPVEFAVQDAFDLTNLAPGTYDLIVCTQSLHHFPAGWVAVMFASAVGAAGRGVVFTDGYRSALAGAGAIVYGTLRARNPAWVHDAVVSTRRCYVPEELELLARIADPRGAVESSWLAPGHCLLRRSNLPTT